MIWNHTLLKNVLKFFNTMAVTGVSLSHYTAGAEKEIKESDQLSSAVTRIARLAGGLGSWEQVMLLPAKFLC